MQILSSGRITREQAQIPAYHEYPPSGSIDPSPLPKFFIESVAVICMTYFRLL